MDGKLARDRRQPASHGFQRRWTVTSPGSSCIDVYIIQIPCLCEDLVNFWPIRIGGRGQFGAEVKRNRFECLQMGQVPKQLEGIRHSGCKLDDVYGAQACVAFQDIWVKDLLLYGLI